MKKKNILVFILSILLVAGLIYGLLRVIIGRQRRVNLDASMKYANILSQDISDACYTVEVTDNKLSYDDLIEINCYFSSDKNKNNMTRLSVNSNGELEKVSYYSIVDKNRSIAQNVDDLNEKISKMSSALMATHIKLKYGDFVNLNSITKTMVEKVNSSGLKKEFILRTNGGEEDLLSLEYIIDGRLGFDYLEFSIY